MSVLVRLQALHALSHRRLRARAQHLGSDASETTVKRAPLADYRIVYFATHGLVAGDVKGVAEPSLSPAKPAVRSR